MAGKASGSKAKGKNTTTAKTKVAAKQKVMKKAMVKPILRVMKSALKKKPAAAANAEAKVKRDGEPEPEVALVRGVESLTAYDKRTDQGKNTPPRQISKPPPPHPPTHLPPQRQAMSKNARDVREQSPPSQTNVREQSPPS